MYCREHFAYEESIMPRAKYTNYAIHKGEHIELTSKALTLARIFNENRVVGNLALLRFLKEWTQRHILSSDGRYSVYLRAAGIE
jgi:hemerythrin